ncbi:hypothetical protein [Emticicia agri]|nr:hypothetical protein [Emticicia agri]
MRFPFWVVDNGSEKGAKNGDSSPTAKHWHESPRRAFLPSKKEG